MSASGHCTSAGRLEDVVAGAGFIYPVRRLAADGLDAGAEVVDRGYEGLVAKDEASAYESGPTRRWLKVKQRGWTVEEDRWRRTISGRRGASRKESDCLRRLSLAPLAPHQPATEAIGHGRRARALAAGVQPLNMPREFTVAIVT